MIEHTSLAGRPFDPAGSPDASGPGQAAPISKVVAGGTSETSLDPTTTTRPKLGRGFAVPSTSHSSKGRFSGSERFAPAHRGLTLSVSDLAAIQEGLQSLPSALVLLDREGQLIYANREAERLLSLGNGIFLDRSNRVRCREREAQSRLCAQLAGATAMNAGSQDQEQVDPSTFWISRDKGLPLIASVIGRSAVPGHQRETRAFILLRDPERSLEETSKILTELFGLSVAEASVAVRLASGESPEQIAEDRKVSVITVRNQVKSASGKLGVRRQVELVSIVLRTAQH